MAPLPGLGPVKPNVRSAAEVISKRFGITNIGGFATSGHIPNSDHYKGLAIDVMLGRSPSKGPLIVAWAQSEGRLYGVKDIIYNRRYHSNSGGSWKSEAYTGSNPHTSHVHIGFNSTVDPGDEGVIYGPSPLENAFLGWLNPLKEFAQEGGVRLAGFVGGGIMIVVAIVMMTFNPRVLKGALR